MKADPNNTGPRLVILSRRNLMTLLAKLDGHPKGSACAIIGGDDAIGIAVIAEEDEIHYAGRIPGVMHHETESRIKEMVNTHDVQG